MKIFAPTYLFTPFFRKQQQQQQQKKNPTKQKKNKQAKTKKRQQRRFRCTGKLNQRFPMYFEIKFYFPK